MKRSYFRFAVLELLLFTTLLPSRVDAAAAPYKVVYTFGGLNDRSGILWVARDAGFFTSTVSTDHRQRAQCAGGHVHAGGRELWRGMSDRARQTRRYPSGAPLKHVVRTPDGPLQGFESAQPENSPPRALVTLSGNIALLPSSS